MGYSQCPLLVNMSEKLCLQWNDFNANVNQAFGNLKDDNDFADVTLASEDGHQVEAHKVILAASSPFFKDMLVKKKHSHPLIYMKGVKTETLMAMVDFLYTGEANVSQESLDSFLAVASDLQLKGLMSTDENELEMVNPANQPPTAFNKKSTSQPHPAKNQIELYTQQTKFNDDAHINNKRVVAKMENYSEDLLVELDQKVKSLMEKGQNMISVSHGKGRMNKASVCKVCGKEGQAIAIRDHIEANHLDGIVLPCNFCEKTFRSRCNLRKHMYSHTTNN